ncbi:hypothetical protein Dimus_013153 [Dionaea muscipula]
MRHPRRRHSLIDLGGLGQRRLHTHGRQPPSSSNSYEKRGFVEHESRGRRWTVLKVDDDRHIPPELKQIRFIQ